MEKERHILDWLNSIADEKIRNEAIANYDNGYRTQKLYFTFQDAIACAFFWERSPQGRPYWSAIAYGNTELREVPDGLWHRVGEKWYNANDFDDKAAANDSETQGLYNAMFDCTASDVIEGKKEVDELIKDAISLLKAIGYKVLKPVTTYEEV